MQYIFDAPQWQWTRAYEPTEFCNVCNTVRILDGFNVSEIWVNTPAEFYRYILEIHKSINFLNFIIFLRKNGGGYDFIYTNNGVEYRLWYYRNLPPALNPEIE